MTAAPFIPVRDIMARDPQWIDGMATISQALAVMEENNISSLVVDRRNPHDEFGLLLIGDVAQHIISRNRPTARTNVYEVMVKPAPAVNAEMNIKYAIRHMMRFGLSHSIVLDERELSGVVTLRDLVLRYIRANE